MNDAFRITVHWSDRIIEVRFPRNPTIAAFARCHEEVKLAVARITKPWMLLVDDTAAEVIPPGLLEATWAASQWSVANGLVRTAAVTRFEGPVNVRVREFADDTKLPRGVWMRFATREEAWAALLLPGTTPANGMRAIRLASE